MPEERNSVKKYEELTFADDFMFCKILQSHPGLCRELAELILEKKLGKIKAISKQHPIEITSDGRGVRFDVFLQDERNTVCDIEMQTRRFPELPKRTRYYQSMIDLESLERSEDYGELPQSYVIFISRKNPFPEIGRHKYSFCNTCLEQPGLKLADGTEKIFISTEGTREDISDGLKSFLAYLTDQKTESDFTARLDKAVENAKKRKRWGVEYMTLYEMRKMDREEGRKEGADAKAEAIAIRLIRADKMSDFEIAKACGLTEEQVTGLREKEQKIS